MGASFPPASIPAGLQEVPSVPTLTTGNLVILDDDVEVSIDFFKWVHLH